MKKMDEARRAQLLAFIISLLFLATMAFLFYHGRLAKETVKSKTVKKEESLYPFKYCKWDGIPGFDLSHIWLACETLQKAGKVPPGNEVFIKMEVVCKDGGCKTATTITIKSEENDRTHLKVTAKDSTTIESLAEALIKAITFDMTPHL